MKDKIIKFLGYKKVIIINLNCWNEDSLLIIKKSLNADLVFVSNKIKSIEIKYI
jgi:hypothetical protein